MPSGTKEWQEQEHFYGIERIEFFYNQLEQYETGKAAKPPFVHEKVARWFATKFPDIAEIWNNDLRGRIVKAHMQYRKQQLTGLPGPAVNEAPVPDPKGKNPVAKAQAPVPNPQQQPQLTVLPSSFAVAAITPQTGAAEPAPYSQDLVGSQYAQAAPQQDQQRAGTNALRQNTQAPTQSGVGHKTSHRLRAGLWDATSFTFQTESVYPRPGGKAPWNAWPRPTDFNRDGMRDGKFFNLLPCESLGACWGMYGPGRNVCPHAANPEQCQWNHSVTVAQLIWLMELRNLHPDWVRFMVNAYNQRLPPCRQADRMDPLPKPLPSCIKPGLGAMITPSETDPVHSESAQPSATCAWSDPLNASTAWAAEPRGFFF